MSLFQRREKAAHFTIVGNQAARDPNLSLKAKGLLLLMLSFSEGWTYRMSHIETLSADKEHATKSALRELMTAGYVLREKNRNEDGTFQWVYTVDDEPFGLQSETTPQFSTDGLSTDGKTGTKKNNPRKPTKEEKQTPSRADAQGAGTPEQNPQVTDGGLTSSVAPQAAQGTPDGVAADAATLTPDQTSQDPQQPARSETEAPTTDKGSAGPAAAPRAATEHQAMMAAIRAAVYPGTERCADKIEVRLAAASKQLRSAGLSVETPAAIVAHIRARHPWRKFLTPETLVEHSAEWASLTAKSAPAAARDAAEPAGEIDMDALMASAPLNGTARRNR